MNKLSETKESMASNPFEIKDAKEVWQEIKEKSKTTDKAEFIRRMEEYIKGK